MKADFQPTLKLSVDQIKKIQAVQPVFQKVEETTGVPWEAVAAVWYRESFTVQPPKTPGGPFQFDPTPSRATQLALLVRFTQLTGAQIYNIIEKGLDDFENAALMAACWLRYKVTPMITPNVSDEVIKEAFYGYNGRAYGAADRSPYVMNGFDAAHHRMQLRGTIPDGKGGRHPVNIIDTRPGAFTVYKQLKSLNDSN